MPQARPPFALRRPPTAPVSDLPLRTASGLRIARGDPPPAADTAPVASIPSRALPGAAAPRSTAMAPAIELPAARKAWSDGVALAQKGRLTEAAEALSRAVRLAPENALYWLNLSSVRRRQHRHDAALECARRAFELEPANRIACHLVVELLRNRNQIHEALQVLRSLDPQAEPDARHHLLDGALHVSLGRWTEAAQAFLQVLTLEPGHLEAYGQLGFCLANLKQYGDAAECFRTVALLEPSELGSAIYAAHYAAWACDWQQGVDDERRMAESLALQAGREQTPAFSPFCLLSMNDDAAMHRRAAEIEARRIAADWRAQGGGWQAPAPGPAGHPRVAARLAAGERVRIGFVSADFRTHATSLLLVQVLEQLDRRRFEVILYSHGRDDASPLRQRIVAAADRTVECAEMAPLAQLQRIQDDGIAILIDLSGYTQNTRLGLMSRRPAPVQALWLAYPGTTGADWVDYLIGDPVLTPLAHAADFSEHIAQLPVCYEPTDRLRERPAPGTRAECGLPEGAFVYACFNQSYKITEPVFSRWCRILQQVPGSVLWLLVPQESIRARLTAEAQARGLDPARLVFAPFVSPSEHLARLPCADLFLDTFPYGAHTTCSDALWMGLPVLTQVGRSFSARVAASLLNAVGIPDLAAADEAHYEAMAVQLAAEPALMAQLRQHLDDHRLALPLFDSPRFTRELEALFERMLARWQAGLPPAALAAEPLLADAGETAPCEGAAAGQPQAASADAPAPTPAPASASAAS